MDSALHQLAGSQRSYPGDSAKTGDGGNEVVKRLQLAAQRAKPSIRRAWNDPVHPTPAINLTSSSIDLAVIPTVSSENLVSGNRTNADPAESPTRMKSSILITESLAKSPILHQCNTCYVLLYEYLSVYFPRAISSNTKCLTDGAALPTPSVPPGLQMYVIRYYSELFSRSSRVLNNAAGSQTAPML